MRLAVKTILVLAFLYLLLLGSLAYGIHAEIQDMAGAAMEEAAHLVGREVAAALEELSVDDLLDERPAARRRLYTLLSEMAFSSQVVANIAVVDHRGQVLASDEFVEIGGDRPRPEEVFAGSSEAYLAAAPGSLFANGGSSQLFVPLHRRGALQGYLQLELRSPLAGELVVRARRRLWVVIAISLLALSAAGALLHLHLSRRGRDLAHALEGLLQGAGEPPVKEDEFARAFEVAGEVGRELSHHRRRSAAADRRIQALSRATRTGALLLDSQQRIDFANQEAVEALEEATLAGLTRRWEESLRRQLAPLLEAAAEAERSRAAGGNLEVEVGDGSRSLRFEVSHLPDGDGGSYLVLIEDLGAVDALETDLRQAAHLRSLAGIFMATAHDLKAPLNALILNAELLQASLDRLGDLPPQEREKQAKYLSVLRREIEHLDRSLQLILSQAIPRDRAPERFDLRSLCEELVTLLRPQARRGEVELAAHLPAEAVPVEGNRDRLQQAILNIAVNALEAMSDGGRLDLDLAAEDGRARLRVADTGPGIPPEVLPRIWNLHFTTKDTGTGIGLYVARSVVRSHGGDVEVETTQGEGTSVTLYLPLSQEE